MLKKLVVAAVLITMILTLDACGGSEREAKSGTSSGEKISVDGKKIYTQNCVLCHGIYGNMGASGAFNLTESDLSMDERIAVITNGRNVMTAFKGDLSEEEIKAVAEYTETLKK